MNMQDLYAKYLESSGISTDTRTIQEGSVFFSLKGDKFNANEFAKDALAKGARYVVIDDEKYAINDRYIVVDDVLKTIQQLARMHRDHLKIPFVGLTGSNGKTTSKELLKAILETKFKTHATKGNLNNHIGVPLTILSIDQSIEIAIIEMGANHLGEIALLCEIANPTHGLVTNIGKAHVGTFGGFENIIRAKSELYQHLLSNEGTVFINSQNQILANMAKRFKSPLFYPAKGDFYHAELLAADPFVRLQAENGEEINTNIIGGYNFENIAAALCIGKYFGVEESKANRAIANYEPANMRSQVITKDSNTIILDAYNANPSSMQAAIENLSTMKAKRKVLILGDMYELEEETEQEHRLLGGLIKERNFSEIYLCGQHMKSAYEMIPSAKYFSKKEDLLVALKDNPIDHATILIKASRGMGLENVVENL